MKKATFIALLACFIGLFMANANGQKRYHSIVE